MDKEFQLWLKDKPDIIKKLAGAYPPGEYVMSDDAPYQISRPGTRVQLYSYSESGSINVVVLAESKLPEAIAHERALGKQYNKSEDEMEKIIASNILVEVDPKYLLHV